MMMHLHPKFTEEQKAQFVAELMAEIAAEKPPCLSCDGEGVVELPWWNFGEPSWAECPACDGTGSQTTPRWEH